MDPVLYNNLIYYLQTLEFPPRITPEQQQQLLKTRPHYFEDKQKLYLKSPMRQVLLPPEAQLIFQLNHNHPLGGYFGYQNTLDKITRKYYWPTIRKDIQTWVSSCDHCQRKGKETLQEQPHSVPVPTQPFSLLSMDIKHVSSSRGGHRYIIVAIDYFTKWTEARALIHANSIEVYNFFVEDIICRHSTPHTLITDNGSPFRNLLIDTLCEQFKIKHRYSSAYHPQGNGLVERFNRTLGGCLMMLPNEEKADWHLYLQPMLYSYRTIVQASTRKSPFELLYGYYPRTPADNNVQPDIQFLDEISYDEILRIFTHTTRTLQQSRKQAHDYLLKAQAQQQKMTLKKLKGKQEGKPPFQTGDLVLWYDDAVAEDLGAKIQDRYTGPYIVQQGFNNGTYLLKTTQGQVLPRHVHGNKLKIYKSPNLQTNGFLSTYPNELTGTTTGRAVRFRTYMPPPQQ